MRRQRPTLNITDDLHRLIADICRRVPEMTHINPRQLLVCLTRARGSSQGGTFAKIVPMRFADGTPFKRINGNAYALPQIPTENGDVLYLIYIYVPRFFAQSYERRLLTLIHELYHIAPAFDGTIRRIGSRAHGASREQFNANLQPLVDQYLAANPPDELLTLLHCDFPALSKQVQLVGRALPLPKAIRLN